MVVEVQEVVEAKMRQMNCPICKEKLYSEIAKGCKLCGMPLEPQNSSQKVQNFGSRKSESREDFLGDESREFCSKVCRRKYKRINNQI